MYDNVVDVPRPTKFYDGGERLPTRSSTRLARRLSAYHHEELGEPFVTAGMCLYRDGRDSVAWHGDRIGRSKDLDTIVAILSPRLVADAGAPPARWRPHSRLQHKSLRFPLGHGDLVVMGGSCQRTWDHAIPKTSEPGRAAHLRAVPRCRSPLEIPYAAEPAPSRERGPSRPLRRPPQAGVTARSGS